ncbi:ABC transporter permease subunit [Anaeromicropila herbilytica]|uniref:ABC transporter permease n=1 Tax=Anaeromicropila herbilytica TaxID=2785025 RepID=A0A7R7EI31_9FIRM|nr:ABC transporter permease subunit [Anaeromicropila herbilytica]BCN28832.1 ABC transporter permease [Anaeromicropila herbilytica]
MSRLIRTELYKFIKQRKNQLILEGLALFFIGVIVYYSYQEMNYDRATQKSMQMEYDNASGIQQSLSMYKASLEKANTEQKERMLKSHPRINEEFDFWDQEKITSFQLVYYYKNHKVKGEKYRKEIEIKKYENLLIGAKSKFISKENLKAKGEAPAELQRQITLDKYLIKHNIKIGNNPYHLTGINFLYLMLKGYIPMILLGLVTLLCIDIFIGEMEEGSYKLYLTQPFARGKIFISKIISAGITSVGVVTVLLFISFCITSIMNGVGDIHYPETIAENKMLYSLVTISNSIGNVKIVSIGTYLVMGYSLFFVLLIATVMMTMFISVITDSTSVTIGVITGLILLSFVFSSFLDEKTSLHGYYFLGYINIYNILNAQINAPLLLGILLNGIIVILLFLISCYTYQRKDLLGGVS